MSCSVRSSQFLVFSSLLGVAGAEGKEKGPACGRSPESFACALAANRRQKNFMFKRAMTARRRSSTKARGWRRLRKRVLPAA